MKKKQRRLYHGLRISSISYKWTIKVSNIKSKYHNFCAIILMFIFVLRRDHSYLTTVLKKQLQLVNMWRYFSSVLNTTDFEFKWLETGECYIRGFEAYWEKSFCIDKI